MKIQEGLASQAAMVMSALGEVDVAFEITNTFFAVGEAGTVPANAQVAGEKHGVALCPGLFTPPIAGNARRSPVPDACR